MTYYPKSQISTPRYTNGEEYQLVQTLEPYTGFYYITSKNEIYTGKNPNDGKNLRLSPITLDPEAIDGDTPIDKINILNIPYENYPDVKESVKFYQPKQQSVSRFYPKPILTQPTQQDRNLGIFSRYFCKKNNENIYIEINKEQFTNLTNKESNIAWDLYTPKQVLWQIKGDQTQTYNANKTNVSLIEQRDKWYGFTQYFRDRFLKYYLDS